MLTPLILALLFNTLISPSQSSYSPLFKDWPLDFVPQSLYSPLFKDWPFDSVPQSLYSPLFKD